MNKIYCIGGAALQTLGMPDTVLRLRDTNVGHITECIGGVAHNVAVCLSRYQDMEVELVTAIGNDVQADRIRSDCKNNHVGLSLTYQTEGQSAIYLSILDSDHDMLSGISDMRIIEKLGPDFFSDCLPSLNASDGVMMDANLSQESIAYLCEHLTVPIFFEPVSRKKSLKIKDYLDRCFAIKPNRFEASAISGCNCDTIRGAYRAVEWFLDRGVKQAYISLGGDGVVYGDDVGCGHIHAEEIKVIHTDGAGDYFFAGVIHECIHGADAKNSALAGNHASALYCSGVL